MIIVTVGYYYHFSLICRDVSEFLNKCVIFVHHTTTTRWVHEYGTLIYQIWKRKNKKGDSVWHLDETYIKVKGGVALSLLCD